MIKQKTAERKLTTGIKLGAEKQSMAKDSRQKTRPMSYLSKFYKSNPKIDFIVSKEKFPM